MAKASELRDQSVEELEAAYLELSKELFELRNERQLSRKVERPHLLRERRRDAARLLTILNEKAKAAPSTESK